MAAATVSWAALSPRRSASTASHPPARWPPTPRPPTLAADPRRPWCRAPLLGAAPKRTLEEECELSRDREVFDVHPTQPPRSASDGSAHRRAPLLLPARRTLSRHRRRRRPGGRLELDGAGPARPLDRRCRLETGGRRPRSHRLRTVVRSPSWPRRRGREANSRLAELARPERARRLHLLPAPERVRGAG